MNRKGGHATGPPRGGRNPPARRSARPGAAPAVRIAMTRPDPGTRSPPRARPSGRNPHHTFTRRVATPGHASPTPIPTPSVHRVGAGLRPAPTESRKTHVPTTARPVRCRAPGQMRHGSSFKTGEASSTSWGFHDPFPIASGCRYGKRFEGANDSRTTRGVWGAGCGRHGHRCRGGSQTRPFRPIRT